MTYKYATQDLNVRTAKAVLLLQNVSSKQSIEVASFIRGRSTKYALAVLASVAKKEMVVPYKRFTNGAGHKKGSLGPGKFPLKTIAVFEKAVKLAIANAADKALNTDSLKISSIVVNRGPKTPRYGRNRGRTAKVTHIEIVVMEVEEEQKSSKKPVTVQKEPRVKPKVESESKTELNSDSKVELKESTQNKASESQPAKKAESNKPLEKTVQ